MTGKEIRATFISFCLASDFKMKWCVRVQVIGISVSLLVTLIQTKRSVEQCKILHLVMYKSRWEQTVSNDVLQVTEVGSSATKRVKFVSHMPHENSSNHENIHISIITSAPDDAYNSEGERHEKFVNHVLEVAISSGQNAMFPGLVNL